MQLRQLEAFRATMLSGSMSQAAQMLNITQPTISRLIAGLEHSLGFTLFVRGKRALMPTPEAKRFFDEMRDVEDALKTLRAVTTDIRRDRASSLTILTTPALGMTVLPAAVARFVQDHPKVAISIKQSGFSEMYRSLERGAIDIVFSNKLFNIPDIENEELVVTNFICALPGAHPLTAKDVVSVDDLRNERIIVLEDSDFLTFHEHSKLLETFGQSTKPMISTGYSSTAYALVKEGVGIGLLEPFSRGLWEKQGVAIRPFRPQLKYSYTASFSTSSLRTDLARKFFLVAQNIAQSHSATI